MSVTTTEKEYRTRLTEILSERNEVKNIKTVEVRGTKQLYIRLDNSESNVQIYNSLLNTIDRHNYRIRFISVLDDFYDEQLRLAIAPDIE